MLRRLFSKNGAGERLGRTVNTGDKLQPEPAEISCPV